MEPAGWLTFTVTSTIPPSALPSSPVSRLLRRSARSCTPASGGTGGRGSQSPSFTPSPEVVRRTAAPRGAQAMAVDRRARRLPASRGAALCRRTSPPSRTRCGPLTVISGHLRKRLRGERPPRRTPTHAAHRARRSIRVSAQRPLEAFEPPPAANQRRAAPTQSATCARVPQRGPFGCPGHVLPPIGDRST